MKIKLDLAQLEANGYALEDFKVGAFWILSSVEEEQGSRVEYLEEVQDETAPHMNFINDGWDPPPGAETIIIRVASLWPELEFDVVSKMQMPCDLLQDLGLTPQALALKAQVPRSTVDAWLEGRATLTGEEWSRVKKVLSE